MRPFNGNSRIDLGSMTSPTLASADFSNSPLPLTSTVSSTGPNFNVSSRLLFSPTSRVMGWLRVAKLGALTSSRYSPGRSPAISKKPELLVAVLRTSPLASERNSTRALAIMPFCGSWMLPVRTARLVCPRAAELKPNRMTSQSNLFRLAPNLREWMVPLFRISALP